MEQRHPVLYSFRRCPYAMRARMAIRYAGVNVELREIILKCKPEAMLNASPKGTVPVLVLTDGAVLDESIDIINWALSQGDPDGWKPASVAHTHATELLLDKNDNHFKTHLDHYKYHDRFPEFDQLHYRRQGEAFLALLDEQLATHRFLLSNLPGLIDIAIFPFIRQFAYVDIAWFRQSGYTNLIRWLDYWLESSLFESIMEKYPAWDSQQQPIIF